jgi:hypothetical protein
VAGVLPESKKALALLRKLAAELRRAGLEGASWELDYDQLGFITGARCAGVAVEDGVLEPLAALWHVIKRANASVHLILEMMKEVVDGDSGSALRCIATVCVPDLVVEVARAELLADWNVTAGTYDRFLAAFDTEQRLLLQLESSTTAVQREAEVELRSLLKAHPERMPKLLRLAALAADSSSRAFPATVGSSGAAKLARIVLPRWLSTMARGEPFPLEYHPLVRHLDGKLIPGILAKTPMAERAALFRRVISARMLSVDKKIRALAPPEILAEMAAESKTAAKHASETAARRAAAPYRFVDPVCVLPGDYSALDDVAKAQWRTAAGRYVESGKVKDPKDFIRQLAKEELDASDAQLQYWKVLRGKKHVLDLWVVWVDNGSFFVAGQRESAPVHIVQGSYLALADTPEARKLAADLADSERGSLWELPRPKKRVKRSAAKPRRRQ